MTATPTPASVDSVMALAQHYACARVDVDRSNGASNQRVCNAANSLRAEVERLAAQTAPVQAVQAPVKNEYPDSFGSDPVDSIKKALALHGYRTEGDDLTLGRRMYFLMLENRDLINLRGALNERYKKLIDELTAAHQAGDASAPAVRMLMTEECKEAISQAYADDLLRGGHSWEAAIQRKFCAVNAGRTIPADGKIGGV